jgi:alpha-tubulin suppressor-like RCC1 family protein
MVAGGDGFSAVLRTDGTVFAWGDEELGSLGNNVVSQSSQRVPQQVIGLTRITQIAVGQYHGIARRDDGTVYAWGPNTDGRLGLGSPGGIFGTPQQVPGVSNAVAVAAGLSHSMALLSDGSVRVWGANSAGQLGLGDVASRASPTPLPGLTAVQSIHAGGSHSAAILADGTVRMWGSNADGQLGVGDKVGRASPTAVSALAAAGITQLSLGRFHTLARGSDGSVWAWGANNWGQAAPPPVSNGATTPADALVPTRVASLSSAIAVAAGHEFSVALLSNGTARTWGNNGSGQLGTGQDGNSTSTATPQLFPSQGIESMAAGRNQTLLILTDGRVGCTGSNFLGQCGRGDIIDLTSVPVEVGPGFNAKP